MKPILLKVFPEVMGPTVTLMNFQSLSAKQNEIVIDLLNCRKADSVGVTLLTQKLVKMLSEREVRSTVEFSTFDNQIAREIASLGFFDTVSKYCPEVGLFTASNYQKSMVSRSGIVSYPIYTLEFGVEDRRAAIAPFRELLRSQFDECKLLTAHSGHLIMLLSEIAKNSADHTQTGAHFGLDITTRLDEVSVQFAFIDFGPGIHQNVKEYVSGLPTNSRKPHLSVYESYRTAMRMGFTSKPDSGINFGLGMSSILELAKGIDLHLSVFDSQSRGIISDLRGLTHREMRRNFFDIRRKAGFAYYGEATFEYKG